MKCAIMQPTYLPWAGYFHLMASVDCFIFLDDVQFEKQSWQSRNRILLNGKECMLSVPVLGNDRIRLLPEVCIDYQRPWPQKHLKTIRQAYARAAHVGAVADLLEAVYAQNHRQLVELNIDLISRLAGYIGLATPLLRASGLHCEGKRSERLQALCRAVGATEYLSPPGSRQYLEEDRFAEISGLPVSYRSFLPAPYPQRGCTEFVSHLSVVDVLAWHGPGFTRAYVA